MYWLFYNVFFNRERIIFLCIFFMMLSYVGEEYWGIKGLFSASGTIFTLAGLMLNIKATNIFHLRRDGKPLDYIRKSYQIDCSFGFANEITEEEAKEKVKQVEWDEISGLVLIVFGTLLWGYGSYLFT